MSILNRPSIPNIKVRGIRQKTPSGYVLGRVDPNSGEVQLISISELTRHITNALVSQGALSSARPEEILSIFAPGPFTSNQNFVIPAALKAAAFPSGQNDQSFATCKVGAHSAVTFYWLSDLAAFLALGAPNGVLAQFDFAANTANGVITWTAGASVILGQVTTLLMPSAADASFSTVHLGLYGDVTA